MRFGVPHEPSRRLTKREKTGNPRLSRLPIGLPRVSLPSFSVVMLAPDEPALDAAAGSFLRTFYSLETFPDDAFPLSTAVGAGRQRCPLSARHDVLYGHNVVCSTRFRPSRPRRSNGRSVSNWTSTLSRRPEAGYVRSTRAERAPSGPSDPHFTSLPLSVYHP